MLPIPPDGRGTESWLPSPSIGEIRVAEPCRGPAAASGGVVGAGCVAVHIVLPVGTLLLRSAQGRRAGGGGDHEMGYVHCIPAT